MKHELKHESPLKLERLVLGCMDSYDSNQIFILQGFSRSTRFTFLRTAPYSKFADLSFFSKYWDFANLSIIIFVQICHFRSDLDENFSEFAPNFTIF